MSKSQEHPESEDGAEDQIKVGDHDVNPYD